MLIFSLTLIGFESGLLFLSSIRDQSFFDDMTYVRNICPEKVRPCLPSLKAPLKLPSPEPNSVTVCAANFNVNKLNKLLNWSHCLGICTDGATSMTGKYTRFVAQTK
uniref:Uncharacterized protein n=1 Tax=Chrysemys picta bellii TaxID=8478 RepID=A0A8C3F6W5_CHRPI